ncbi:MAG: SspB family protein [Holosporales bacterium]
MSEARNNELMRGFDYDQMVQSALRRVVCQTLQMTAKNGLPGSHHFYLTFETNRPDVKIPDFLRERHPQEVTIVLQHQFWDLDADEEGFRVTLSFNDSLERIAVPYAALISFLDPSVKFGLQFIPTPPQEGERKMRKTTTVKVKHEDRGPKASAEPSSNVVTLDAFRKK